MVGWELKFWIKILLIPKCLPLYKDKVRGPIATAILPYVRMLFLSHLVCLVSSLMGGSLELLIFWNKWEHCENKHHLLSMSIFLKYQLLYPYGKHQIKIAIKNLGYAQVKNRTEPGISLQLWLKWSLCKHGLDEFVCLGCLRRTQPLVLRIPEPREFQEWEMEMMHCSHCVFSGKMNFMS